MEMIEHFSHEHPLVFSEHDIVDDEKPYLCSICGLVVILTSPSYRCSFANNCCKFFVHEPCAKLPQQLSYSLRRSRQRCIFSEQMHILSLKPNPSNTSPAHFIYICVSCRFEVHPLSAGLKLEIKIKHESHQPHPLTAFHRQILCKCDACGEKQEGFFFYCHDCDFWIHQDCILLPPIIKIHPHPHHSLFLVYSGRLDVYLSVKLCKICGGIVPDTGFYFCSQCRYYVHFKCASSNIEASTSDESDTFPSLVIRAFVESETIPDQEKDNNKKKLTHSVSVEDHFLTSSSSSEECLARELILCNVCIQPIISSPYYRCRQQHCHFLVHNVCANLPSTSNCIPMDRDIPMYTYFDLTLVYPEMIIKDYFYSVFRCSVCRRPCNGCSYKFVSDIASIFGSMYMDLECTTAPRTLKHASHGNHVLYQDFGLPGTKFSCCDRLSAYEKIYRCVSCDDFTLHVDCALLPKRAPHKFDKHPLELIMTRKQDDDEEEYCFCEFCEKGIDKQYWFYHCAKCDQFFHVKCIPSVGYLSKVKFGGTLNISGHHHHLVTLTRMLMEGSHRCGYCKQIVEGFVDDMAFCCSKCDFWIHFNCARDCTS